MKRTMLLLLVLTATGCIELPIRPEPNATYMKTTKTADAIVPTPAPVKEVPAVAPDQVSDGNAPQVLDALRDELDHAAGAPAPKP
jgi:hypothetical protein